METISPLHSLASADALEEAAVKSNKDDLVSKINRVDKEISKLEGQISGMAKKQVGKVSANNMNGFFLHFFQTFCILELISSRPCFAGIFFLGHGF